MHGHRWHTIMVLCTHMHVTDSHATGMMPDLHSIVSSSLGQALGLSQYADAEGLLQMMCLVPGCSRVDVCAASCGNNKTSWHGSEVHLLA